MIDIDRARMYFHHPERIGERIPRLEERRALSELERCRGKSDEQQREHKIGKYSFWISGDPSAIRAGIDARPVEWRGRIPPAPLEWFDHENAHVRHDAKPERLALTIGRHLAGHQSKPTPEGLAEMLRKAELEEDEAQLLWELFEQLDGFDALALVSYSGASAYEIARVMHLCGASHGRAVGWINQFAEEPERSKSEDGPCEDPVAGRKTELQDRARQRDIERAKPVPPF